MFDQARISTAFTGDIADLKAKMQEAQDRGEGFKQTFSQIGQVIAGAFSARAIIQFGMDALRTADQVSNLSERMGLSAETTQSLTQVAEEAGLTFGDFESALVRLNRAQADAQTGNEKNAESFHALGISIEEVRSLNPEQLFERVARALSENSGSADATSAAYDLLGRSAGRSLEVIKSLGAEGFDALNERMRAMGLIMSNDVISNLDRAEESLSRSMTAAKNWGIEVLGSWGQLWERAGDWYGRMGQSEEQLRQIAEHEARRATENQNIAQEQMRQADIQREQQTLSEARATLAALVAERTAATLSTEERLAAVVSEINSIESQLSIAYETQNLSALERTNLEIRSEELGKSRKKLEDDIAKEALPEQNRKKQEQLEIEREMMREIEQRENMILTKEAQLEQLRETNRVRGLTVQERINELTERKHALEERINAAMTAGVADAEALLDSQIELEQVNAEITNHMGRQRGLGNELKSIWGDLTTEQAESLIALRDALADMSDEEINRFIQSLRTLANELTGISWPDMAPLRDIASFDLPAGVSSRIRPFGEALRALARELRDVQWPDMTALETIGQFDIRSGISGRARPFGEAIRALAIDLAQAMTIMPRDLTALNIIRDFRLPQIDGDAVDAMAEAITDLGRAFATAQFDAATITALRELFEAASEMGNMSMTIEIVAPPGGIPESIPITLPDSPIDLSATGLATEETLSAIAAKIEAMEGVIWR